MLVYMREAEWADTMSQAHTMLSTTCFTCHALGMSACTSGTRLQHTCTCALPAAAMLRCSSACARLNGKPTTYLAHDGHA